MAKVLELQLQHQSFQWIFRVDFLWDWLVWSPCCLWDSQESSPQPRLESINSLALSLLYGPALTSIHDYWKSHSFDYAALCWQSDLPLGSLLFLNSKKRIRNFISLIVVRLQGGSIKFLTQGLALGLTTTVHLFSSLVLIITVNIMIFTIIALCN